MPYNNTGILEPVLVAVVEENKDIAEAMQLLLQNWGYQVLLSIEIDSILDKIRLSSRAPDVILSELLLTRNQRGIDSILRIRALCGSAIPALIITACEDGALLAQVKQCNIPVLHKPVRPEKLHEWICHTLQDNIKKISKQSSQIMHTD